MAENSVSEDAARQEVRRRFQRSADIRARMANDATLSTRGAAAIAQLLAARDAGGCVYAVGDRMAHQKADHFMEEMRVRYRAGAPFGRPDRPAVASESLIHIAPEHLPQWLRDNGRGKDAILFFVAAGETVELSHAMQAARDNQMTVIVVAGARAASLVERAGAFGFLVPSDDAQDVLDNSTVFIHALCEAFEPEFVAGREDPLVAAVRGACAIDTAVALDDRLLTQLVRAREEIKRRTIAGGGIDACGNGGSTCDAIEFIEALSRTPRANGKFVRAHHFLAPSHITCAYNDNHPVFKRGVEGIAEVQSVLVGYSTSGSSVNVIEALEYARSRGIYTVGLTGKDGGKLAKVVDCELRAPSVHTERIQECHEKFAAILAEF